MGPRITNSAEMAMQIQVNKLASEVGVLTATQKANHEENRKDIHRLFNGQQALVDSVTNGLDNIANKIGDRIGKVEGNVLDLRVRWAKAAGYVMGISALGAAVGAVFFEAVKVALEKTVTR